MSPLTAESPADSATARREQQYWQKNLKITGALLGVWFVVTFGFGFLAADLNGIVFGWPFSFWAAAQGALVVYCVIVWYYAHAMNRLDEAYGTAGD